MPLKFVFVPWGCDSYGEEVWLLENALILGLEAVFEAMDVSYADLYDQLNGSSKRLGPVAPFQDSDLLTLASKAPADTTAVIDGLITGTLQPADGVPAAIEFAPRILDMEKRLFQLPDAFRFEAFSLEQTDLGRLQIEDQVPWHTLIIMVAEAILELFDTSVPANIGPETLQMTSSWPAYCAFIKGKRGARTIEEKLGYYRQASRLDPKFFWARFNAGQLYKQQQDYHSARREFLAAAESVQEDTNQRGDVYFELGLCSIFLGDTKTARNFWDQALLYSPNNPVLLVNVAGTYEQEEDWQNAMKLHQAALDANPNYYKAIVNLARLKAQTGLIDEAIPLYEKALTVEPDDPLRHAILGGCYLALGDEIKARQYFDTASSLDPPGSRRPIVIDEAGAPPAPGEYARQELEKMDKDEARRRKDKGAGWRWFGQ